MIELVTNLVPEIGFSHTRNWQKNRFKAIGWKNGFLQFLSNFHHTVWWFFKGWQHLQPAPLSEIVKYAKNLANNEEKPCSTCLKPISPSHFQNRKPEFRVRDPSLKMQAIPFYLFCYGLTGKETWNEQDQKENTFFYFDK